MTVSRQMIAGVVEMHLAAGVAVLLMSCIGHAELLVILVNRFHSKARRHCWLKRFRRIHDIGLPLFPVFIVWAAGFGEHGLLNGGAVRDLPISVQGILLITCAGCLPFLYSVLRWHLRSAPKVLAGQQSESLNFLAAEMPDAVRADILGQQTLSSRLPFNEIYQLEVNHKQLCLPLRGELSRPLRIAHFSDMHMLTCPGPVFHQLVTDRLCELKPDIFAFTGDLLDSDDLLPDAVKLFRQMQEVAPGYFILGNHDWHLDFDRARREICSTGWIDVAEKHVTIEYAGSQILLAGTEAPWIGTNPNVPARNSESLRLLLSHAPDQRDYAVSSQFDLMLCGHNHGGQVVLPVIGPVYSPSCFGTRYAGGVFRHRNLVIHVSRGTGASDTIRWNCRPEITLLEIEVGSVSPKAEV